MRPEDHLQEITEIIELLQRHIKNREVNIEIYQRRIIELETKLAKTQVLLSKAQINRQKALEGLADKEN